MVSIHAGFLFHPESVTARTTLTRRMRRVRNHVALGTATLGATWAIFAATESTDPVFRASIATAYVALGLFIVTLAFGPYAALKGRR